MKKYTFLLLLLILSASSLFFVPQINADPLGEITFVSGGYGGGYVTVVGVNPWTGEPWGFWDVWNASSANGWGVVAKQDETQYLFSCSLRLGDYSTSTLFTDSLKQITFESMFTANNQYLIVVSNYAELTLGTLADAQTKRTRDGCTIFSLETTYYGHMIYPSGNMATVKLYGCSFFSETTESWWQAIEAYNINCNGRSYPHVSRYTSAVEQNYNNIIVSGEGTVGSGYGIRRPNANTTINNLFITVPSTKVWFQSGAGTVKNVWFRGGGYTFRAESISGDCYIINPDDGGAEWSTNWAGTDYGSKVYRQYEFDLNLLNPSRIDFVENANVTLTKNGTLVGTWLTNSSGMIPTQTLTYGWYTQATGDVIQGASEPFMLTVTHSDYTPYKSRFYVTQKTRLTISLQPYMNASFTWAPSERYVNETVFFDASESCSSSSIQNYRWSFGDGLIGFGEHASHVYAEEGNYTVAVTVSSADGESTDSKTICITAEAAEALWYNGPYTFVIIIAVAAFVSFICIEWYRRY